MFGQLGTSRTLRVSPCENYSRSSWLDGQSSKAVSDFQAVLQKGRMQAELRRSCAIAALGFTISLVDSTSPCKGSSYP